MKQKKTMRLWQMIVILVLSIAMLATMFMPAFKFSGSALVKKTKKIMEKESTLNIPESNYSDLETVGQSLDESLKELEQEYGIKLSGISSFSIMTKSFTKLLLGKNPTEEDKAELEQNEILSSIKSKYGLLRILLWVVYGLAFIVLVMTILGFCLKMSKYIPLIISTFYSVFAAVLFGYFRFALLKGIGKKLASTVAEQFANTMIATMLGSEEIISKVMSKFMTAFYGIGFLAAFIIAILMLIFSILFMFIGNRPKYIQNDLDEPEDDDQDVIVDNDQNNNSWNGEQSRCYTVGPDEHINGGGGGYVHEYQKVVKQAPPKPMGLVRCTKGVAAGQGFSLPQDRKVIVGKSPQNANLVINNINVSNVHCSIRYNATTNTYFVKDHSTNGTFANGARLQKETAMEFQAGTVLSLADGSNEITLG